ncbi:hypothetical protein VKT23_018757 [Stygiomarasmius scandens]|uniref:DUF6593 domain-containing protein n=1 Tax=Marasmiellus scandens TaxID=2682957 RepID=A0ABR1INA3_9AGAR
MTFEAKGEEYTWSMFSDSGRVELSLGEETVAWFERERRFIEDGKSKSHKPHIAILPAGEKVMDEIIVSAVIMEQKTRHSNKDISPQTPSYNMISSGFSAV